MLFLNPFSGTNFRHFEVRGDACQSKNIEKRCFKWGKYDFLEIVGGIFPEQNVHPCNAVRMKQIFSDAI